MSEAVQHSGDTEDDPYQVMPAMGGDELAGLKADIRENGVEDPVHIDENGDIIDGHHRVEICDELGIDDYPTKIHAGLTDREKRDLAYRLNLQQRHLEHGEKQNIVEQYLTEDWDGDNSDEWHEDVANTLGVGDGTVRRAYRDTKENGELIHLDLFPKSDRRQQVRDYIDENPDASNREVSRSIEADIDHKTVGNWRNEWEDDEDEQDEDDEPQVSFSTFSPTGDDEVREKTKEISDAANEGDETAEEKAQKVDGGGETAVDHAHKDIERQQQRDEKREQVEEAPEIPDGEYEVLLADPPWQYEAQKTPNRAIENHYATMSNSEIEELDVPAADDAVLYMWTTAPKLEEAFGVLDAWGFEYTTCAVWDKQKIGMGYWFRGQHELILVAKNGSFSPPDPEDRVSSVISEPRGEHSEKPDALHELIEDAFPNREKIELFARDAREGWDSWGDEV